LIINPIVIPHSRVLKCFWDEFSFVSSHIDENKLLPTIKLVPPRFDISDIVNLAEEHQKRFEENEFVIIFAPLEFLDLHTVLGMFSKARS